MRGFERLAAGAVPLLLAACQVAVRHPDPVAARVARGEKIFFEETFDGNGRTCGTCHRAEENFSINARRIATLPADDPLFAAESNPALAENFENPALMRRFGLILENLDGFGDLPNRFAMRGVPHTLALRTSVASPDGPRTGWSGDGAPGDGSLRSFAVGAVIQHFTKSLDRVAGVDFRLPKDEELDALEAFQLSLGRQRDPELPLPLRDPVALRGQEIFLDPTLGKCNLCHQNAGANSLLGGPLGNRNFDTGVEDLPDRPQDLAGELVPPDDGFGIPGDRTFNTPPLVEAADTGPFFHDGSVQTLEAAVGFYDGDAFNESPAGRRLAAADPEGTSIELDATQIEAVAAFLRVLNALENLRASGELLDQAASQGFFERAAARRLLARAAEETQDAVDVLSQVGIHLDAVAHLERARDLARRAERRIFGRARLAREALREQAAAHALMISG